MNADAFWQAFCREKQIDPDTPHSAWAYGAAPDKLAELTLAGIKTATASGYELYFLEDAAEPLPRVGDYSIILNAREEAVCIIRTTKTTVVPFDEVGSGHAFQEGEGDRSLAYWRRVHEEFFTEDFAACGLAFTHTSPILCEEFRVVYPE